ncbi:MAG: formyltetrahydrofolate deformylase [Candidatus Altarchaeaceae archaeon]
MKTAILLLTCPDAKGIVANVTNFIFENNGNILHLEQHIDSETNTLFMRVEFDLDGFKIKREDIKKELLPIANKFKFDYDVRFSDEIKNVAIFVGKEEHCLWEILFHYKSKDLKCNIPLIISNHEDLEYIAKFFKIDFYFIEKNKENKEISERKELELLKKYNIDLIVLAKYMQILSKNFVDEYRNKIINVHHSFLPAFAGAKPYLQAYKRGVKLIGATAHYVTEELDNGPIIEQEVIRISHKDSLQDLIKKGQDLEKLVIVRAMKKHLENKILVYNNKTIVFE